MRIQLASFPRINTPHFELRALELTDVKEIYLLRSDDGVNKYLDRPKAESMEDALHFIEKIRKGVEEGLSTYWAISPKSSKEFLGSITLWNISGDGKSAEIGYELLPVHQGKGIMQEVIPAVIRFGFLEMKLDEISAELSGENLKSISLLKRNGFKKFREERIPIFKLAAADWKQTQHAG